MSTAVIAAVKLQVKAVGGRTPQLEKSKLRTPGTDCWSSLEDGLRRIFNQLAAQKAISPDVWAPGGPIYTYIAGFAPLPEQRMVDLYDCFAVDGELLVQYSLGEPAFG